MPAGNGQAGLEFARFGSSIPTSYWGCCCADIIQNFNVEPDAKASIQIAGGDSGNPIVRNVAGGPAGSIFCGPTYRDIFHQRLRIGTFGDRDMPNHAFFAIITQWQIASEPSKKWLPILKEAGFEFLRSVSNSVGAGGDLLDGEPTGTGMAVNHVFALFRNIGRGAVPDPFTPPKDWTDLPSTHPEPWKAMLNETVDVFSAKAVNAKGEPIKGGALVEVYDFETLAKLQREAQLAVWNRIGPVNFLTEAEVVAAEAPVFLAGKRSLFPPQEKSVREKAENEVKPVVASAFPASTATPAPGI